MNFIKNIFHKKDESIKTYTDFWNWFQKNEKVFFETVKSNTNIEKRFFDKLSEKLEELKEGFYFVAGMYNNETAELVITVDGNIKNIVFAEELIASAPKLDRWKFTALKSPSNIKDVNIKMAGYNFNSENIYFYDNELNAYPDEIDITVIHTDLNTENRTAIINGTYIFIENYLGEIDFINNIDKITIISKEEAQKELVPITKLKDFLIWRQKEFIEKYEGVRYNTENDNYIALEAELESGNKLFAIINEELLNWNNKASHPWIAIFTLKYDGKNNNGMPNNDDYKTLNEIEEEIMLELKDFDGYLNIGRETADGEREIYFACKDFRKPSKVFYKTQQKYSTNFQIDYQIYKDKYWQSFKRYD